MKILAVLVVLSTSLTLRAQTQGVTVGSGVKFGIDTTTTFLPIANPIFTGTLTGPAATIGGFPVCLSNGTNCPAATGLPVNNPTFTGLLSGPSLVINGQTQLPNYYDFRATGPVTTSGDQTTAVTTAWNAAITAKTGGLLPPFNMSIASSVSPSSGGNYSINGLGGGGQFQGSSMFTWTGGTNGVMFNIDRNRDANIGHFNINMNGSSGSTALLFTQLTATTGQISSHDFVHDLGIFGLNGGTGIQYADVAGDSGSNNEAQMAFHNAISASGFYNAGSNCFITNDFNQRDMSFYENETSGCGVGYWMNGESNHIIGGLTEGHTLALSTGGIGGMQTVMAFTHDELSKQGVVSTAANLMLLGTLSEIDAPDTTKPWWDFSNTGSGSIALTIGNAMRKLATGEVSVAPPAYGKWISIGDHFGGNTLPSWPPAVTNASGSAIQMGVQNLYGNADLLLIHSASTTEGTYNLDNGGIFLAGEFANVGNNSFPSPPFTISAGVATSTCRVFNTFQRWCYVPFTFQAVVANTSSSTAPATLKLEPPTDPITGTTWAGPMNFDYATNSNNGTFTVSNLQAISSTIAAGHMFTRHTIVTCALSPAQIAANTSATQTAVTCTGVAAGDIVLNQTSAKASDQDGLILNNIRVTGANTISLTFANLTASPITPTAAETYTLDVEQ